MAQVVEQLENIPGFGLLMDAFNDYAEEHFNNTNPFEDKNGKRPKLGPGSSPDEKVAWKKIQRQAWIHDRCFLGLCGIGLNFGLGLVPLAVFLLPIAGPIVMYVVHSRLLSVAHEHMYIPKKMEAKMQGNIMIDLLISLPPGIGALFSWLHGCLTRNAGMIYVYLQFLAEKRQRGELPTYLGRESEGVTADTQPIKMRTINEPEPQKKSLFKKSKKEDIQVGEMQMGVV